jgi:hypothetical protein
MSSSAAPAQIPATLSAGRQALDAIANVEILRDLEWEETSKAWLLHIRLKPPNLVFNEFVPPETEWLISVDEQYPFGDINFFPSKENGIVATFPHQALNNEGRAEFWRDGKICLSDPYSIFEDRFLSTEPFSADERLAWHVERALGWLEHASRRELLKPGDFFELPAFPARSTNYSLVGFDGSKELFDRWKAVEQTVGLFDFYKLPADNAIIIPRRFYGIGGKNVLVGSDFGAYFRGLTVAKDFGMWIRAESLPVVPPWKAPITWGELETSLRGQDIDLREKLDQVLSNKRSKDKIGRLLLLGFPVPDKVGNDAERLHWLAIELPEVYFKNSSVRGFRPSGKNASLANRSALDASADIAWIESENWAVDQILSRGSLPDEVLGKRILLAGGGALGSAIAEMLVRGGVYDLTICDPDRSKAGNLVRHSLDMRHLKKNKAKQLAKHLNEISPWANVEPLDRSFPSGVPLEEYDVVIDCTGNQKMLRELGSAGGTRDITFVSASMSFAARRLYLFVGTARSFPFDHYRKEIEPWLDKDGVENADVAAPREGAGCWHPVFPARSDDVWLWGSIAVKSIPDAIMKPSKCGLRVFEQSAESAGPILEVTSVE